MEYFRNHVDEAVALNRSNSNFGFEIYRGGPDTKPTFIFFQPLLAKYRRRPACIFI
jgi:hypothetical protein